MELSKTKKEAGRYCCAYACKNKPVKKLGGLCYKHYQRKRRKEDPVGVRYSQFKNKAKARGIYFNITIKEFRDFCQRTGYLIVKGRRGQNATIDRRCNVHGYEIFNIQLLTLKRTPAKAPDSMEISSANPKTLLRIARFSKLILY